MVNLGAKLALEQLRTHQLNRRNILLYDADPRCPLTQKGNENESMKANTFSYQDWIYFLWSNLP